MNIRGACLVILWITLNVGYAVPQFNLESVLNRFENGNFEVYNVYPSRNTFPPRQQPQQNNHNHRLQQQSSGGSCDQLWSYESDYNGQFGRIRISRPHYRTSVLRVVLTIAAQLPSEYVGSLSLTKSPEGATADISQGLPIFYRVDFPLRNPVPSVNEIYYNNQLVCSAPRATGSYVTTITLHHKLETSLTHPPVYQDQEWPQPQPEVPHFTEQYIPEPITRPTTRYTTQQTRTTTTRRTSTTQRPFEPTPGYDDDDDECGIPAKPPTSTGLIINGQEAYRGQFPWLAALFHENDFICGGSLISHKLVITAAHCIQHKEDNDANRAKAQDILFYFGKRNLQTQSEQGSTFSPVSEIFIHPDWDYRTQVYDADISIAVLTRTIVYSKFVRPICLWTGTNSFDDVIGVKGRVAGWGLDENKEVTTAKPKWAEIPAVTSESCLRSHPSFRTLTSERTFCAGESVASRVGGAGPCNGDSGGGFIVKNGSKWYLRGIISAAIRDPETGTCNPETFSVFTDAAKFTSWIRNFINQYG